MSVPKAYVISLAPYIVNKMIFPYGPTYHTNPRLAGERYGVTEIEESECFKDFGEGQKEYFKVSPVGIGHDLIRDLEQHGLFVTETLPPAEADLAAAEAKQRVWYESLIGDADSIWSRTQDPKQIPFHARVAANSLGLKRDWASDLSKMEPCKSCHELVMPDIAKCPKCQAILSWEAARDLGLVTPEQERFAVKRGLLKSTEEETPAPTKKAAGR